MPATRPQARATQLSSTPTRNWAAQNRRPGLMAVPAGMAMVAAAVLATGPAAYAAQAPVGLGQATSFAVLGGSGITNTGATTIRGDVGSFPTPSETGFGSVTLTGTNHGGDSVTQQAKTDLLTAYNDAAGRGPVTSVPVELGGTTKLAGVYGSGTLGLTGTLTLDAQGNPSAEFIFQAGSTLITASNSQVLLLNGASACNVVWQVGSSATFGTGTQFAGDVLAETSITADTGATFLGRLLAQNGAVTLDHNTITSGGCAAPAVAPTTTTTSTTTSTTSTTTTTTTTVAGTTKKPSTPVGGSAAVPGSTPGATVTAGATPKGGATAGSPTPSAGAGPTPAPTSSPPLTGATPSTGGGSATPPGPPGLPFTGGPIRELSETSLVLLALGALVLRATTRRRRT